MTFAKSIRKCTGPEFEKKYPLLVPLYKVFNTPDLVQCFYKPHQKVEVQERFNTRSGASNWFERKVGGN
jgi:hypothetical protein